MPQRRHKQAVLQALRELSAASDLLDAAVSEQLAIHRTDLRCLDYLARSGPVPAGQLGHAVGLTSGALTIAVDRLERAGFVHRQPDSGDRRRVLVALAPGADPVRALLTELRGPLERRLATYSEAELQLLVGLLQDIRDIVSRQAEFVFARTRQYA